MFSEQDIPTYEITNNIIKMQITGTQSERTELLAKVLGEEFAEYNNKFNQEIKITFINTSTNEILTQSSFFERIVAKQGRSLRIGGGQGVSGKISRLIQQLNVL